MRSVAFDTARIRRLTVVPCRHRRRTGRRQHGRGALQASAEPRQWLKEREGVDEVGISCFVLSRLVLIQSACRKLLRRFEDLDAGSSALSLDLAQGFETLAFNSSAIASALLKVRRPVVRSRPLALTLPATARLGRSELLHRGPLVQAAARARDSAYDSQGDCCRRARQAVGPPA